MAATVLGNRPTQQQQQQHRWDNVHWPHKFFRIHNTLYLTFYARGNSSNAARLCANNEPATLNPIILFNVAGNINLNKWEK